MYTHGQKEGKPVDMDWDVGFFFRSVRDALLGPQALTGFALTIAVVTVLTLGLSQRTPSNDLFSRGLTPITTATMDGFAPSAKTCGECHLETYQEGSTSRHAASFSNPISNTA